ncbi:Sodium-dependent nutrient amino acid transporter 1 [Chionoecetes opilio]|uniref:Sodium-dependent nutrient amino acid transporter 1 n=1 Tax=Chionoecetes opilio TaxID=41210 RepID=A0A8J4XX99_CHIOP|nr:Sodium-dependent nutrient amino acid transporter 1 [Chionoecetes opilio]
MAVTVFYFAMSFNTVLPWSVCDDAWADENCVDASSTNVTYNNKSQSSSEQYYYQYVIHLKDDISDGIGFPDWRLTICLVFSWIMVFFTLAWGVKSSGKVAYFTALFPYVVLFTLLVRGVTLPGAIDGMLYFITPKWEKLLDPNVWFAAVSQSFFSLSVGFGPIITFSSYNSFSQNIYRDAWIISFTDTFTSLLAGFTIFAILGNLSHELDTNIEDVVRGGGGLAFVSYPDALAKFDWAPQLFAVLFFLMLFTLGVGSAAGLAGCFMGAISDTFPSIKKVHIAFVVSVAGFLCGLVYVTQVDVFTKACWVVITPLTLLTIFVYNMVVFELPTYNGEALPQIAYTCGWILTSVAVGLVPLCFLHSLYHTSGDTVVQRLRTVFQPTQSWGPGRSRDKIRWEKLNVVPPS